MNIELTYLSFGCSYLSFLTDPVDDGLFHPVLVVNNLLCIGPDLNPGLLLEVWLQLPPNGKRKHTIMFYVNEIQ
jgi:hypothetical protein